MSDNWVSELQKEVHEEIRNELVLGKRKRESSSGDSCFECDDDNKCQYDDGDGQSSDHDYSDCDEDDSDLDRIDSCTDNWKIPVTQGDNIIYAIVDKVDYEDLKQYSWHIGADYASAWINRRQVAMHRLIAERKYNKSIPKKRVIDHKDQNKYNNQRSNLFVQTHSYNAHNRPKKAGSSSQYKGVCFIKPEKSGSCTQWRAKVGRQMKQFLGETSAAYWYDMKCFKKWGTTPNNMAKPDNYETMCVNGHKRHAADMTNIYPRKCGTFNTNVTRGTENLNKTYKTVEEARDARDKFLKRIQDEKTQRNADKTIPRSTEGYAYVLSGGATQKQIYVDDDIWMFLQDKTCTMSGDYVHINLNGRVTRLHHYVLNRFDPDDDQVVDHINHKPRDNRRANLEVKSVGANNHNREFVGEYKGITKRGERWGAQITANHKWYWCGTYDTQELAACAHNHQAITLYGKHASLNKVTDQDGYTWNPEITQLEKIE